MIIITPLKRLHRHGVKRDLSQRIEGNDYCEICGVHEKELKGRHSIELDHDHEMLLRNRLVERGLLCTSCNIKLMWFERGYINTQGKEWIEKAKLYLTKYKTH